MDLSNSHSYKNNNEHLRRGRERTVKNIRKTTWIGSTGSRFKQENLSYI